MIDSHCHLADEKFEADLEAVVARAQAAGLASALCILSADETVEVDRADRVRLAWPAVKFAVAIHPHRSGVFAGRALDAAAVTREAAVRSGAVALGEMGLDYHYDYAPRDVQRDVFAAQVDLAVTLGLPVCIHTREATDDTLAVLRGAGRGRVSGVMHCFSGTVEEARLALDLGFFVSFAGILTFPKADAVREVARFVPADRVLVETDAPFLAPVPYRGQRNEPAWVLQTLARLAALSGRTADAMGAQVSANFAALTTRARVDTPAKPVF